MSEITDDELDTNAGDAVASGFAEEPELLEEESDPTEDEPKPRTLLQVRFGQSVARVTERYLDKGTFEVRGFLKRDLTFLSTGAEVSLGLRAKPVEVESELEISPQTGLPVGSVVIFGPSNLAKTPLLKRLVAEQEAGAPGSAVHLRFGEPLPGYMSDDMEAAFVLTSALLDPKVKLIAIDSIKDMASTVEGASMARGLPRPLFTILSQWGQVACSLGKTILTPLNISTDDKSALQEAVQAAHGNTTAVLSITTAEPDGKSFKYRLSARQGEGRKRRSETWTLTFGAQGQARISRAPSQQIVTEDIATFARDYAEVVISNPDVMGRAIARSISRGNDKE